jgi:hypothetical protein
VYSLLPLGINFRVISRPESEEERSEAAKLPYEEIIESLMFTTTVSCPDITYCINKLAQFSGTGT